MPRMPSHHVHDFVALGLERLQIVAEYLDGRLALHSAHRFFHVVGDRLREIPERAGNLLEFAVHGGDQLFLVLMKYRTPFLLRLEVDEIFGVEEAAGVGSVIRPSDLRNHLFHFRKGRDHQARPVHHARCRRRAGARRQRGARPDRAFVQMRQKFGADGAAHHQIHADAPNATAAIANCSPAKPDRSAQHPFIAAGRGSISGIAPFRYVACRKENCTAPAQSAWRKSARRGARKTRSMPWA